MDLMARSRASNDRPPAKIAGLADEFLPKLTTILPFTPYLD
jgi:hypothetical protein